MNNKTQTKASEQLVELPLTGILPSGNNPRIINEKDPGFVELVESVKAKGIIVPIHVRSHPTKKDQYELLAGERRFRAACKAEKTWIRAINHGDISDEDAFEITFIENFAREDLTPLEQGKAVVILLTKYKNDVRAVASKMGKSIKWIRQRQALGTKLSKDWRKAIAEDDDQSQLKHWTASHLQLIARLPEQMQAGALENFQYDDVPTLKQLDEYITELLQLLNKAPFDIAEAGCAKCQKRTSCQPGLFDDTLDPDTLKKNDRCLDQKCWDEKTLAWLKAEFEAKKKELPALVAITTDTPLNQQAIPLKEAWPDFFQRYSFQQARKKDEGAYPGFIIYGKALGTVLWIKPTGYRAQEKVKRAAGKPTPLKERRVMLKKKRWSVVIRKIIEQVSEKTIENLISKDRILDVMALALEFGTSHGWGHKGSWTSWAEFSSLSDTSKSKNREHVAAALWKNVRKTICDNLTWCGPITQTPDDLIGGAMCAANLCGIEYEAMFNKVAEQDYPEPKSWKGLNVDGTPKKAKPKKAKSKKTKSKKTAKKKTAKKEKQTGVRTCRECGCTDDKACVTKEGPCHWVEKDLCSACAKGAKKKNDKS